MLDRAVLTGAAATWRLFAHMDEVRRAQGRVLDALGFGPQETPSRVVLRAPGMTLKGYGEPSQAGPVILLVPAPIKRAYIWDLAPGASVVEHCLNEGTRPYLIRWEEPAAAFGLEDYGDRLLLRCIDAIAADTGEQRVFLAGHSLGGLLAAIFASLHSSRLEGLVLLASPIHFDLTLETGALGPVIATLLRSGLLEAVPDRLPGSCLGLTSFMASPQAFGRERWVDWLHSLPDHDAIRTHLRVERWTLDELPLTRRLVVEIGKQLYREDAFLRGRLVLDRRTASAREVVTPLLIVADRRCGIVPPGAVQPFLETVSAADKRLLWYEGDVGVALQHVGMLIGRNAHRLLWPEILRWVHGHHDRGSSRP